MDRPSALDLRGGSHPNAIRAEEIERQILGLLTYRSMRTSEIAQATGSGASTTINRFQRMRDRGAIIGGGANGWTASAAPS